VIDRRYPLDAIADAFRYVETGQKTGIVVIDVMPPEERATTGRWRHWAPRDDCALIRRPGVRKLLWSLTPGASAPDFRHWSGLEPSRRSRRPLHETSPEESVRCRARGLHHRSWNGSTGSRSDPADVQESQGSASGHLPARARRSDARNHRGPGRPLRLLP